MTIREKIPKYRISPLIRKYYESWLNGPTLFDHPNDEERFYRFTKACLKYGRKHYDGQWLRYLLRQDLLEKYGDEDREYLIKEAVSLFDRLMDFGRVSFPNHSVEMRNPELVGDQLRAILKPDKSPVPLCQYE